MGVCSVISSCDSTAVSNVFIDEYMNGANDAEIKIYLYLLRMMSTGEGTTLEDIADRFNHTEKEVTRSLWYWERKGLLDLTTSDSGTIIGIRALTPRSKITKASSGEKQVISITPFPASAPSRSVAANISVPPTVTKKEDSAVQYSLSSSREISQDQLDKFQESESNRQLLFVVEQYIGKPLSSSEMKTVCFISEELHFSDELVDYLIDYCVSLGKRDFHYIEKVASNWYKDGISTTEQAKKYSVSPAKRTRQTSSKKKQGSSSRSRQREQRTYDFEALEKELLEK